MATGQGPGLGFVDFLGKTIILSLGVGNAVIIIFLNRNLIFQQICVRIEKVEYKMFEESNLFFLEKFKLTHINT